MTNPRNLVSDRIVSIAADLGLKHPLEPGGYTPEEKQAIYEAQALPSGWQRLPLPGRVISHGDWFAHCFGKVVCGFDPREGGDRWLFFVDFEDETDALLYRTRFGGVDLPPSKSPWSATRS